MLPIKLSTVPAHPILAAPFAWVLLSHAETGPAAGHRIFVLVASYLFSSSV